jgi:hypothetical protein
MTERRIRDQWETGRVIPLPKGIFDHSLSDAELQDRWVAAAQKKLRALYEDRLDWLGLEGTLSRDEFEDGLQQIGTLIEDAEGFLRDAKRAQRRYHETKGVPPPRPAKVQALLTRRTPAQVQQLLDAVAQQSTEIAGKPDDVLDVEWQPKLPKPR